jgi:hypothetical protein
MVSASPAGALRTGLCNLKVAWETSANKIGYNGSDATLDSPIIWLREAAWARRPPR